MGIAELFMDMMPLSPTLVYVTTLSLSRDYHNPGHEPSVAETVFRQGTILNP